eukprot:gene8623-8804_t
MQWPLIDKDDARDCLQTLPAAVLQNMDANQLSYDIMFSYCRTQLSLGLNVAVDCPFARVSLYDAAVTLAQQHGAQLALIECSASNEQLWRQQLEARGQQHAATTAAHKPQTWQEMQELLQKQVVQYEDCWRWTTDGSRSISHFLRVDTTASDQATLTQSVVQFLQSIQSGETSSGVT